MRCRRCGTRLSGLRRLLWALWSTGHVECPESEASACRATELARYGEPPDREAMDWTPQPPEDIDVCVFCKGHGEVFTRRDWETGGYEVETCRPCEGTGRVLVPWSV